MKLTKARLQQIIKEEIAAIREEEQMGLDFRPPEERELDAALASWDEWKEEQVARDVYDYGEPDTDLLVRWLASRQKKSGRKYIHMLPAIVAEYGFDKRDVIDAIKKYGTKSMMSVMKKG